MAKVIRGAKKYTYDSSLRKLKTQFEDQLIYLTHTSAFSEVRERWMSLGYEVLRRMAEKLSIVSMIVNTREYQVMPFLMPATELGQPGFIIYKKEKRTSD